MTQILFDDQHKYRYIDQLENLLRSTFLQHEQIKCFQTSSTSFEFCSCPLKLAENIHFQHPFHSIFLQTFENFHQKYRGASSKTLIYFFVRFVRYFSPLIDRTNQKKLFEYLDDFLDETIRYGEKYFYENLDEKISSTFCQRVCRSNEIYGECLYQMFVQSIDDFHHFTRVKSTGEHCRFVSSILLLPNSTTIRQGICRTILLDGHLIEDFQHIGFNKTKSMKIQTISSRTNWLKLINEILDENRIEMIITTGTIDSRLKTRENFNYFENVSIRILRQFDSIYFLNYLTDLDPSQHILSLDIRLFDDDLSLVQIHHGFTLLHDVPTETCRDVKHHQFEHCLGRWKEILRTKSFVDGSGLFEEKLSRYLTTKIHSNLSIEESFVLQGLRETFESFHNDLISNKDLYQTNFIDDYPSKIDAWKTSLHLLKIFVQIDSITKILDQQSSHSDL